MKRYHKKISVLVLLVFAAPLFAQTVCLSEIRIAPYRGDKACAITYTFDDGLVEQYTLAAPFLERLGFRGTFFINGSRINEGAGSVADTARMTWTQLKELSDKGHEVSNHGWAHKNFGRHTLEEIREDIFRNDSAICKHTGSIPLTFCYPNNSKTPEGVKIAAENRVGTRTKQRSIGSKSTSEELEKWVGTLIETCDWGVGMTHGMTYGYDAFRNIGIFEDHLERVKAQEEKIWVGTFREVAAYLEERENTTLSVEKKKNRWIVTPRLSLDKNLFTEPLTAVIEREGVKKITIKQNKKRLIPLIRKDRVLFDFDPSGGPVEITFNK